jgi:ABC-2 type transport system permease protein
MKSLRDEWSYVLGGKFIFVAFLIPLIFAALFGYIFSHNQINKAKVIVIDEDNSSYSHQLINEFNASQYIEVANVIHYVSNPSTLLYNEAYVGVIYLPRDLELNHYHGKQSKMGLLVDYTSMGASAYLRTGVTEVITAENVAAAKGRLKSTLGLTNDQADGILSNISLQQRLLYNPNGDYMYLSVIGFVNIAALAILTGSTLTIISRLRLQGKLEDELKDPFGLLTRITPYSLVIGISLFFSFGILKQVGGMRFAGSPLQFLFPLFLYTIVSGLLGMFMGWSASHPAKAAVRSLGVILPSLLLSGVQAPIILFPKPIQIFSDVIPFTWLFTFIRVIGFRGADIHYMWKGIGVLLFMVSVLVLLILLLIKRESKIYSKQPNIVNDLLNT